VRAALPVIAFTVLTRAGLGALAWVALAELGAAYAGWPALAPRPTLAVAAASGIALVVAGWLSSMPGRAPPGSASRPASRLPGSWSPREAVVALALVAVAATFVLVLFLDVRPRSVWGWAAATLGLAWTALCVGATSNARPDPIGLRPAGRVLLAEFVLGLAPGAVVVEAIVRPASGPTWLAAAGVATLLAAWLVGHGTPRHPRRDAPSSTLARIAFAVASVVVPALWLVAGLDAPLAGAFVAVACLGGMIARLLADARSAAGMLKVDRSA
jgi:hypothetical protein